MEGTIGEIRGFGGNFAPRAWAFCQGQLLSISQNTALFSILGTTYGGDGRTTFALPDLRGRAPISAGTGPGLSTHRLGSRSGTETVTLNELQMPNHTHIVTSQPGAISGTGSVEINAVSDNTGQTMTDVPTEAVLTKSPDGGAGQADIYSSGTPDVSLSPSAATLNLSGLALDPSKVVLTRSGGSQHHNNMQPYLTIYWIICLQGVFPSRS